MAQKKKPLGRGLGALIADADTNATTKTPPQKANKPKAVPQKRMDFMDIDIKHIHRNKEQPRTDFDAEALDELTESVKSLGIIQPLTVRKIATDHYQIVAGERRFRAAQAAGLQTLPCFVREVNDDDLLAMALVENIQRQDLDAIDIGISYQRLIEECNLTQEALSEKVGKKRSTIANYLRLLKLPALVQKAMKEDMVSMGHARTLVSLEEEELQIDVLNRIVEQDLSVRATEDLVRKLQAKNAEKEEMPKTTNEVAETFMAKGKDVFRREVRITMNKAGKGKLTIPFLSEEDLEEIFKRIN